MSYLERILPEQDVDGDVEDAAPGIAPGKRSLTAGFRRGGSDAPPPPAPPDALDGLGFLTLELGRSLGVAPRVDAGDDAAAAVRAAGTIAFARGDTIAVDPTRVDPATDEGRRVLAHEVVHVAQAQLPGPRLSERAVEAEAHAAGDRLAAGAPTGALRAARDGSQLAAWHLPGEPPPEHELNADGFRLEEHYIQVERGWYEYHYGPSADAANKQPANRLVLQRLTEGRMPWIADLSPAARARAERDLALDVPDFEMNDIGTVPIRNDLYVLIGLPPGTNVVWDFPALRSPEPDAAAPAADPDFVGPPAPPAPQRTAQLMVRAAADDASGAGMSPALAGEALDRLELRVGATLLPGVREDVVSSGQLGNVYLAGEANLYHPLPRAELVRVFGEGAWLAFERRLAGAGAIASDDATPNGEMTDPSIPTEEQHFVRRMLEEIFAGREAGDGNARITPELVAVLHEIDEHPERARIIETLRNPAPGASPPEGDMAAQLRAVMHTVDMRAEYERLGITPDAEPAERPYFPIPVEARIINHTDLLFTGKEAAFSVDVRSRNTPPMMLTVPWVRVQWVVRRSDARETSAEVVARGHTRHMHMLDEPDRFTHAFDEVGTYEVNAVVSLDNYLPNHFTIFVEVRTEDERFAEIQGRAFSPGAWGDADRDSEIRRSLLGTGALDAHDVGTVYEGAMPNECDPSMPVPGSLDAIDRRIEQVESMRDSGRLDASGRAWADQYLTSLREARGRVTTELAEGWRNVQAEGAYLSRAEGASSTPLRIVATAHHDAEGWLVAIHDMTQAFDARNSRFDGDEGRHPTFRDAAEYTFTQMAKAYPRGRMALRIEQLDDTSGQPTGRYLGFELECDSTWEAVHRVVYNPVVSAVINIAGTCVALFVPPSAPFIIPTLIAYNAVDTIGTMVDLGAREALTFQDVAIGAAQIAIDVIPYVGRATRIVRIGSRAYHVMEGLETAGEIVLLTAQAQEQVQSVRMGIVRQAAEVHARITELEATNPSDPELPRLRADFRRMQQEATDAWARVGLEMAAQQGIMRMSMRTLHGIHAAHTARVDASRTALTERASTHGGEVVTASDRSHVQDAFGVPVGTWEGGGDGVRIAYDVSALGGITNMRLEIGPHATVDMVMRHEATLVAMRRYEGVTGSLRNLLERVQAWVDGGGHVPPHTRAFEARFELQKLPPIIASLREELTTRPLDDAMRTRIEQQVTELQRQLDTHAAAFNDLAPGLGYVAAADTTSRPTPVPAEGGDPHATMGARPGETAGTPHAPAPEGMVVPRPDGRAEAAHAALVARRGSDRVPLPASERPSGWTAADEAHFRHGGERGAYDIPADQPYHWGSDATGNPILVRDSAEPNAEGVVTPVRQLDPDAVRRGATSFDERFPVRGDVAQPEFMGAGDGSPFMESGYRPSGAAATEMDAHAAARRDAISRRTDAEAAVDRLAAELGVDPDDLRSVDQARRTIERLYQDAGDDAARRARIDELARQRGLLTTARTDLTHAGERAGNTMAMDYMSSRHGDYRNAHPGGVPAVPGRSGEFDFIYLAGEPPNLRVVVVEAKGAGSGLGVGAGGTAMQGSPPYLTHVARQMLPTVTDPHVRAALRALIDRDAGPTGMSAHGVSEIHYVMVEAPMGDTTTSGSPATTTGGDPRGGRIREFRL